MKGSEPLQASCLLSPNFPFLMVALSGPPGSHFQKEILVPVAAPLGKGPTQQRRNQDEDLEGGSLPSKEVAHLFLR